MPRYLAVSLRTLTETEQVVVTMDHIRALRIKYRRGAQNLTRQYFVDARFNDLTYDRHKEEITLECFEQVILQAGEQYLEDPTGTQIPDWTRALAVMPDLREQLQNAVFSDMEEATQEISPSQTPLNPSFPISTLIPSQNAAN